MFIVFRRFWWLHSKLTTDNSHQKVWKRSVSFKCTRERSTYQTETNKNFCETSEFSRHILHMNIMANHSVWWLTLQLSTEKKSNAFKKKICNIYFIVDYVNGKTAQNRRRLWRMLPFHLAVYFHVVEFLYLRAFRLRAARMIQMHRKDAQFPYAVAICSF